MARGHILKRGKKYSIVIYLGKDENGKKHQKWYTSTTKKEAEKLLAEKLVELEKGTLILNDKITLKDFLEYWYEEYCINNISASTFNSYKRTLEKYVYPYLGSQILSTLKPIQIQNLYNRCIKQHSLSNTTILYIHRILHCAFNKAYKWNFISYNICDKVDAPKKKKYKPSILNLKQIGILLNYLKTTDSDIYIPVFIAITTGMRRGEILALNWSDIDFNNSYISITKSLSPTKNGLQISKTKTENSNRIVSIPNILVEELIIYKKNNLNNILVCCKKDGSYYSPTDLNHKFKDTLKKLGLPSSRFHDLRHAHASLLVAENVQPKMISERLGHSNIGITMDLYSHIFDTSKKEVANIVDKIFKSS